MYSVHTGTGSPPDACTVSLARREFAQREHAWRCMRAPSSLNSPAWGLVAQGTQLGHDVPGHGRRPPRARSVSSRKVHAMDAGNGDYTGVKSSIRQRLQSSLPSLGSTLYPGQR